MDQTTMNRGHLAFIEDQVEAACQAFRAGELTEVPVILESVAAYIQNFLAGANTKRQ